MAVLSWSHSKLADFERCKYAFWLKHDQRIPEPARPLPPGKLEHANDRGSRVHDELEQYVRGNGPMPREASKFADEVTKLRELFLTGAVSLEGEWGMDENWEKTGWSGRWEPVTDPSVVRTGTAKKLPERGREGDIVQVGKLLFMWVPAWLRLKLDALVFLSPVEAVAIDYKTGKKFGNEIKHGEQLQLYQLVTFLRYPALELVHTELWYLDVDDLTRRTFTREQGMLFKRPMDKRGRGITSCTKFPANPNVYSCKWCPYGERPDGNGTGDCKQGVWR